VQVVRVPLPAFRWLIVLAMAAGCASERIDPHTPGDRCVYACPDGMTCAGTSFPRGRAPNPGHCQLAPKRCRVTADCRPREHCTRAEPGIGVCTPEALL